MTPLAGWENFYVIVGSSAGALIGLQFVVITLISDLPITRGTAGASDAFTTPTIVYFGTALLLSAIVCAPWHNLVAAGFVWSALGVAGFVYVLVVIRRVRRQDVYQPQLEDWIFHAWLPLATYLVLAVSGGIARFDAQLALVGIAVVALLLLFIGIHNAWDTVTWHVFVRKPQQEQRDQTTGERLES